MGINDVTVTLGSETLHFTEADRIGALMYKLYHERIDPLIRKYEIALALDIKAISNTKMNALKIAMSTKDPKVDKLPFAVNVRVLINEYRSINEYDLPEDVLIYDIGSQFREAGESILEEIFGNNEFSLDLNDIDKAISAFKREYFKWEYYNCIGGEKESLHKYIEDQMEEFSENLHHGYDPYDISYVDWLNGFYIQRLYKLTVWDLLKKEAEIFSFPKKDYRKDQSKLINDALREIEWRQNYLKNPQFNSHVLALRIICEKAILDLILCTSGALKLGLRKEWFTWDSYAECMSVQKTLQDKKQIINKDKLVIQALKAFPYDKYLYKHILWEFGDRDSEITSLADFFDLDIAEFKPELFKEYLDSLMPLNMDDEQAIQTRLERITSKKQFFGYYDVTITEENLEKRLIEIDIMKRTVNGRLYDTREEAEKVRNDYVFLKDLIDKLDIGSYDLLDESNIDTIKSRLTSAPYQSNAFKEDTELIFEELTPILNYYIQKQKWIKQIMTSSKPWTDIKEILISNNIFSSSGSDVQFWDFNGLKKWYPVLMYNERPIMFVKVGLVGWRNYIVVTNKRIINVKKETQTEMDITDDMYVTFKDSKLLFCSKESGISFGAIITYKGKIEDLEEMLNLIIRTVRKCDEKLFAVPDNYYPVTGSVSARKEGITTQIKGMFTSFMTNGNKTESNVSSEVTSEIKFCSNCGHKLVVGASFCTNCGEKINK